MTHIETFIRYLSFEKRSSVHTLKAYQNDLIQFRDYLELHNETSVLEVTDVMLRSWIMSLVEANSSRRTVNRKLSSLRGFYNYAIRQDWLQVNPMLKVTSLKTEKKIPSFLTEAEMTLLLDATEFPDSYEGKRDQLILEVFYHTGMRLSELIGLKISDIDFDKKTIKVFGKRSKQRIIPVLDNLLALINRYLDLSIEHGVASSQYLFSNKSGKLLYPKFVYGIVNSYLSNVTSVKQKSPHVLRHAFATHMLNDGADLNAIKEILGHTSLTSTQIYTHSSAEHLKNVYKQAHPRGDK